MENFDAEGEAYLAEIDEIKNQLLAIHSGMDESTDPEERIWAENYQKRFSELVGNDKELLEKYKIGSAEDKIRIVKEADEKLFSFNPEREQE